MVTTDEIYRISGDLVASLAATGARMVTKYMDPKQVIRATRRLYGGKLPRKGSNLEILVTIGRPNYDEREFIKKCKKAGEPFPVKKVQYKFPKGYKPAV